MAIVMMWSGIDGEAQIAGFERTIPLQSFSWGVTKNMIRNRSAVQDRGAPTVQEIAVTKQLDNASTGLQLDAFTGRFDKKVSLSFLRTGAGAPVAYLTIELEGAGLTGYQVSAGADGVPVEALSIAFTKVTLTVLSLGDDLAGAQNIASYDVLAAS